jgi:succinate-semialdehyde dehydrogenase/glutarate-semialdehyde dehydrogenase
VSNRESTPEVGKEFCRNPLVKKISFTGSTAVGKALMKQSSDTVKRLSLELGGNAPFIVFDDADIEQAVDAAVASKFRNSGQTCVCADRFIIQESVLNAFLFSLIARISTFKIGPGLQDTTTMGPLISTAAVKSVKEKVEEAVDKGAEILIGGKNMSDLGPNYFEPTVLRNVDTKSKIWSEETFGPVVAIATFKREEEALEMANDTRSGLAAYFCTRDMDRIFRFGGK